MELRYDELSVTYLSTDACLPFFRLLKRVQIAVMNWFTCKLRFTAFLIDSLISSTKSYVKGSWLWRHYFHLPKNMCEIFLFFMACNHSINLWMTWIDQQCMKQTSLRPGKPKKWHGERGGLILPWLNYDSVRLFPRSFFFIRETRYSNHVVVCCNVITREFSLAYQRFG